MTTEEFSLITHALDKGQAVSVRYNDEEKPVKQYDLETQSVLLDVKGKDIFVNYKSLALVKRGLSLELNDYQILSAQVTNGQELFVLYNNERKNVEQVDQQTQSFLIDINGTKIFVPYQKLAFSD